MKYNLLCKTVMPICFIEEVTTLTISLSYVGITSPIRQSGTGPSFLLQHHVILMPIKTNSVSVDNAKVFSIKKIQKLEQILDLEKNTLFELSFP